MANPKIAYFGSIIRLHPEFEERYIILHKHVFPGVLESIRRSNIRNYSIFLRDGILFSYLEYTGSDYVADTAAMADEITREWWRLTDPMQEPLEPREEGKWWTSMELLHHDDGIGISGPRIIRLAWTGTGECYLSCREAIAAKLTGPGFQNLSVYRSKHAVYLYLEYGGAEVRNALDGESGINGEMEQIAFRSMREVFHTDGAG